MKFFLLIPLFLILFNCSKPKTVLICGDHICINKSEANQYFEENLSIEVKILDKKEKESIDLVELNLKIDQNNKRKVSIKSKSKTNKDLKVLSNKEILKIKKNIRNKKSNNKVVKKFVDKNNEVMKKTKSKNTKKIKNNSYNVNKVSNNVIDVCTILEKCSIDEISKFLHKQGKKKKFPDIAVRQ